MEKGIALFYSKLILGRDGFAYKIRLSSKNVIFIES